MTEKTFFYVSPSLNKYENLEWSKKIELTVDCGLSIGLGGDLTSETQSGGGDYRRTIEVAKSKLEVFEWILMEA